MKENKRIDYIRKAMGIIDPVIEFQNTKENDSAFEISSDLFVPYDDFNHLMVVKNSITGKIHVTERCFEKIISIDPTPKKLYVQWLTNRIFDLVKRSDKVAFNRFIFEDNKQISESLKLFETHKKTKLFLETAVNSLYEPIRDPRDINQYKHLDSLFNVVDVFIVRDYSDLVGVIKSMVATKQGVIMYEDYKTIVYSPKTLHGSVVLSPYATWCTTRDGNSYFNSYTNKNKKPNGSPSDLLVFIDKNNNVLYQVHFESQQINTSSNSMNIEGFVNQFLIGNNELISFIDDYLSKLFIMSVKANKLLPKNSIYFKYKTLLGLFDNVLEYMMNSDGLLLLDGGKVKIIQNIKLVDYPSIKSIGVVNNNLVEFPEFRNMKSLELYSLYGNNITMMPEDYKQYKSIKVLNLKNNRITHIPESISILDPSNGGNLEYLCLSGNQLSEYSINEVKSYLPNVTVIA